MSHNDQQYRFFLYIAGIQVPFISLSIGSQFGSLASARIAVPYSPFITRVHEQTKVQIFSQRSYSGELFEPELEFDGIIIGIVRSKNFMGQVSVSLSCLTDGYVWNRRKQFDFYLENIADVDARGTGAVINMRSDGVIGNYYAGIMQNNRFDIGCSAASVLTGFTYGGDVELDEEDGKTTAKVYAASNTYIYNGKKFTNKLTGTGNTKNNLTPSYYIKYLKKYKLANKLYGLSTSKEIKSYLKTDHIVKLLTNSVGDLQGENTFWSIATMVLNYGFYIIFDIPNPTFIPSSKAASIDTAQEIMVEYSSNAEETETEDDETEEEKKQASHLSTHATPLNKSDSKQVFADRSMHGLAEYILKPISVLGVPLKCNIIWPDQLVAESLFTDYANMPTRVLLRKNPLPGVEDCIALTTKKIIGPLLPKTSTNFFTSFDSRHSAEVRESDAYSDYEMEYGISYRNIPLSYAFDTQVLSKRVKTSEEDINDKEVKVVATEMNNFVNYNFAQFFFASRNYNVQVTPDTNIVPGLPVIVMDRNGDHIIAFATGVQKSFDATAGSLTINATLTYPRYYYEDIKELGNIVDPTARDPKSVKELALLFGADPLIDAPGDSAVLARKIEDLFQQYMELNYAGQYKMRLEHQRKVCTLAQYLKFHTDLDMSKEDSLTAPERLLSPTFASSDNADRLSHRYFRVYDKVTKRYQTYNSRLKEDKESGSITLSNQDLLKKHIEWCSEARHI